jgi:hypothetical protein
MRAKIAEAAAAWRPRSLMFHTRPLPKESARADSNAREDP